MIKFKKIFKLSFVFTIILLTLFTTIYSVNILNEKNKIFRLHVRANSNNEKDQKIKEIVAKEIDKYIINLTTNLNNVDEIYKKIINNSDNILKLSDKILLENNINYTSNIYIGNIYFDEKKQKDNLSYDEGFYNTVIITLGEGKGHNFWDLVFPKKEDMENLSNLDNVFPFITNLYSNNENINKYTSIDIYNDLDISLQNFKNKNSNENINKIIINSKKILNNIFNILNK